MTRSSVSERSPECGRDSYEELLNFVTTVERGGCSTFIVHARKAILKGLSPKEVHRLLALMVQKYKY
jgi:tRNA-dihydrouridine synthase